MGRGKGKNTVGTTAYNGDTKRGSRDAALFRMEGILEKCGGGRVISNTGLGQKGRGEEAYYAPNIPSNLNRICSEVR